MGIQESGISGSTAGEVKNRADLVVYWGTNPMDSMPRHLSRYAVYTRGFFRERGKQDRFVVTVDPRRTATAKASDMYIPIKPNSDYEAFAALLTILRGKEPHPSVEEITGISIETFKELAHRMTTCQFGALYGGLGLPASKGRHRNIEMIMRVIAEVNKYTKFTIGAIRGHCNVSGFNQMASWIYGYPFGVDFMRGYPRFNPGEFTTVDLLLRKEVDAVFVMCADLGAHLPKECVEYMKNDIPVVCIDIAPCPTTLISDVVLPGVIDAMECDGTFYRFDNVPINYTPFTKSPFPFTKSNEDTLKQLFERIKEKVKNNPERTANDVRIEV